MKKIESEITEKSELEKLFGFPATVKLSSVGNPDFGQNPKKSAPGCDPDCSVEVSSFRDASTTCSAFIAANGLWGGNWNGGEITDTRTGKTIGNVSYNGRVWTSNQ